MNFEDLQKKKLVEKYQVPSIEIKGIIEAARSDLKTAKDLLSIDICWAFNVVYNSVLEAGIALMHSKGFRSAGEAKRVSVILFLRKALGKKYESRLDRFNQMRRRRNR